MPQVTVYIREEDMPKWRAIEKKSAFLSAALNGNVLNTDFIIDETLKAQNAPADELVQTGWTGTCPHGAAKGFCKHGECNR